jgi:hypothetical protein
MPSFTITVPASAVPRIQETAIALGYTNGQEMVTALLEQTVQNWEKQNHTPPPLGATIQPNP